MQWFTSQVIMLHIAYKINHPAENLKTSLKMFNIRMFYDETIGLENIPESDGIICINCGEIIDC